MIAIFAISVVKVKDVGLGFCDNSGSSGFRLFVISTGLTKLKNTDADRT